MRNRSLLSSLWAAKNMRSSRAGHCVLPGRKVVMRACASADWSLVACVCAEDQVRGRPGVPAIVHRVGAGSAVQRVAVLLCCCAAASARRLMQNGRARVKLVSIHNPQSEFTIHNFDTLTCVKRNS